MKDQGASDRDPLTHAAGKLMGVFILVLSDIEANPVNLDRRLAGVSTGVHRLDGHLLVVLDVDRVLDVSTEAAAA